jgi:hypothetical protein
VDERDLVKLVDHGPIISTEGNMTTIAGKRRLAVEWTNDVEQIDGRAVHQLPSSVEINRSRKTASTRIIERA